MWSSRTAIAALIAISVTSPQPLAGSCQNGRRLLRFSKHRTYHLAIALIRDCTGLENRISHRPFRHPRRLTEKPYQPVKGLVTVLHVFAPLVEP
jgi:hypothetical protein